MVKRCIGFVFLGGIVQVTLLYLGLYYSKPSFRMSFGNTSVSLLANITSAKAKVMSKLGSSNFTRPTSPSPKNITVRPQPTTYVPIVVCGDRNDTLDVDKMFETTNLPTDGQPTYGADQ